MIMVNMIMGHTTMEINGGYYNIVDYSGYNPDLKIPTPDEKLYKLKMRRVEILNGIDATPPDAHVTTLGWVMELRHLEKCIKDLENEVSGK